MDTAVIHEIHLHHIVSANLKKLCYRPAEKVVTDMTEMERLVCVW